MLSNAMVWLEELVHAFESQAMGLKNKGPDQEDKASVHASQEQEGCTYTDGLDEHWENKSAGRSKHAADKDSQGHSFAPPASGKDF
mmetsp:Transcript_35249/g.63387  ORF Transcript_35249/g.63387 Transcript_35249/m.63387 type:complete len:86 (-) Transcript_35249:1333-1590(-)